MALSPLTCHSRAGGNDKESVGLSTYSPLSSRAERGDPVNKKALRADARRHIKTGLPQSYDNVFNVSRSFAMTRELLVTSYS